MSSVKDWKMYYIQWNVTSTCYMVETDNSMTDSMCEKVERYIEYPIGEESQYCEFLWEILPLITGPEQI